MDTNKVGRIAAEFMEKLDRDERELEEDGCSDVEIGEIVVIAEVSYLDEEGERHTGTTTASTTDNRIHQSGIVEWGLNVIRDTGVPADDLDE